MKSKQFFRALALLVLVVPLLIPAGRVNAQLAEVIPPADMFQLPWEQGKAWVALDGFDNGTKRASNSPHNYLNGGAVDFAPYNGIKAGVDTSSFWVTAAAAGTVSEVGRCHLKIDHGNSWTSEYQFLGNIQVTVGQTVYRNQRLAVIADGIRQPFCLPYVGEGEPHLHFAVRPNMRNATFAGWLFQYVPLLNWTTFTKDGKKLGSYQPLMNLPGLQIVLRPPLVWETLSSGSVDTYRYERWPFVLTETTNFTLTATPITDGLTPLLVLLDSTGQEIARDATGLLTLTRPAGNYFVQVQPQAGQGFYNILLHQNDSPLPTGPYVYTEVSPASIAVDGVAVATVGLGNVPVGGYTSTEFTCSYDVNLVEPSLISPLGLFGDDPALALNGPQNGAFIVAIAGSQGDRATTSGPVFTFNVKGLQPGEAPLKCEARISTGDGTLTSITALGDVLFIQGDEPGPTPTPIILPSPTFIPEPDFTPTPTPYETPSLTPEPSPTPFYTPTAEPTSAVTATPTSLPSAGATLTGQVQAAKTVTVILYDLENNLVASVAADDDGNFSLEAPAGTYTAIATASGFLNAQGFATLTAGQTASLPVLSLWAGDIDGNNTIDQFDALTIGMSYNGALPLAADLNADGVINVLDLELLAGNYGKTGPQSWQ